MTSIGNYAFSHCHFLESVTFAEGSKLESIGENAFEGTCLTSIEIPASVTSIGNYAFSGTSMTSVEIPASVTSIGDYAFGSSNLTSIEIPASVTSIGENAFDGCNSLGSVTFAEGSQLESIGNNAFNGTTLTSIEIPASVTSIGSYVFQNCDLASITVADGNTVYDSRNGCNAIIVKATNTLIIGCKNSTIPAGVTSIGNYAFYTTGLTSIEIPSSVTSIGMRAFLNCRNLATVTVYAPSCSLGEDAFLNCNKLANIYVFSDLVDTYRAAENWSAYADKIKGITGGYCGTTDHERDVVWVLTGESTNYTLTITGTGAMADYSESSKQPWKDYRSSIKTVVIGASVTSLGKYTFYGCTSLTSINIPASVTSIGNYTFAGCTGLTSIEIPASVTSIGDNAFWDCSNLATVTFAEDSQLATIGISAFSKCSGLASVEIPAGVTSIGNHAFHTCTGLATVSFAAGSQLTSIGSYAFANTGLTSIEIPASVTSIGVGAFANCSNLEAITVDGGNAVYDSRNNCNAIIEKSSNTLIAGCKNTTIPANVTSIRIYTFFGCTGLTSIEIPAGVTSIGGTAFKNCSDLATVTVYAPSCTLGANAFLNCDKLENIYVFSDLVDNYKAAENWSAYADKITAMPVVIADVPDQTYTGSEITPEPLVLAGSLNLTKGTDYVYSYTNNTNVGTATVTVTFQGDYESLGYVEKEFNIVSKAVTNEDITVTIPSQTWTGSAIEPEVTVTDGETTLIENTDYTVTAPSGTVQDAGNYTYTITGKGNYTGTKEATFTIKAKETNCGAITLVEDQNGVTAIFDGTSDESITITDDIEVNSVTYNRTFTEGKPSTVMLPFSLGEGQTLTGGTLYKFTGVTKQNNKWVATMNEVTGSLTANTPYLLMPNNELTDGKVTFNLNWGTVKLNTTGGSYCLPSDAEGWEFHGTYEKKVWDEVETHDYGFAAVSGKSVDNQDVEAGQFVRLTKGASAKPMRCYLSYVGVPNQARALTRGAAATDEELPQRITVRLVSRSGEVTSIGTIDNGQLTIDNYADADGWYDLQGRKLSGKPTKSGLYIKNGKKFVIK